MSKVKIRLDKPPYFLKIDDPDRVVKKTDMWWISSARARQKRAKIYVRLPKGKLSFKFTTWSGPRGRNQITLVRVKDNKVIYRSSPWGRDIEEHLVNVKIPSQDDYYFRLNDGNYSWEVLALHCEAEVEYLQVFAPFEVLVGGAIICGAIIGGLIGMR